MILKSIRISLSSLPISVSELPIQFVEQSRLRFLARLDVRKPSVTHALVSGHPVRAHVRYSLSELRRIHVRRASALNAETETSRTTFRPASPMSSHQSQRSSAPRNVACSLNERTRRDRSSSTAHAVTRGASDVQA